jgi:peptide/nickel transport system permease protein
VKRYLAGRLVWAVVAIWGVVTLVFVILRLSGDPAAVLLSPQGTKEEYEAIRRSLGLDLPLPAQYALFLVQSAIGNFGSSFQFGVPALGVVLERIPATLSLTGTASALIILVAIPLGVLAAVFRNTWLDYVSSGLALIGQAAPNFWLGFMLILLFAVHFRWVPTSGRGTPWHLVLPALTLALQPIAKITRLTRSEMLDVLAANYVRTAQAKGVAPPRVTLGHALKNASLAIVTVLGLDIGYLLGGAIIVETVFSWPGLGRLVIEAINNRDFPVVQAAVVVIAVFVVAVNVLVDLLYAVLDPRIRLQGSA